MLYFEKAELEAWLRQNPVKTQAQIEQEAQKYILNRPLNVASLAEIDYIVTENSKVDYIKQHWTSYTYQVL